MTDNAETKALGSLYELLSEMKAERDKARHDYAQARSVLETEREHFSRIAANAVAERDKALEELKRAQELAELPRKAKVTTPAPATLTQETDEAVAMRLARRMLEDMYGGTDD